ncbi:hypothetical protein PLICRDRAFT_646759 [Plicaturopsis crispa FD-325 SS-3]|nr:hypothetical protein PLICRDRAFT_646759 [Plicaturopsis crispa FD-325 SS-3]
MMWEVWVRDSEGKEAVWADMQKPISASFICPPSPKPSTDVFESQRIENQNIDVPPTSLTPTSASRPSMFRTIFPGLRESTAPSSTPSKSELASPPQAPPPSAVQVAFMIAMPSEDRRLRSRDSMGSKEPATEGFPGGYELGVAKVPWTHGEL